MYCLCVLCYLHCETTNDDYDDQETSHETENCSFGLKFYGLGLNLGLQSL